MDHFLEAVLDIQNVFFEEVEHFVVSGGRVFIQVDHKGGNLSRAAEHEKQTQPQHN